MNFIQAIILGVVEGVTEFLPISSTFHLLVSADLLGIKLDEFVKTFIVVIQSGAIISVLWLYWQEIWQNKKLWLLIITSFIPTALVGFGFSSLIKTNFFENQQLMWTVFVLVGFVFIFYENYSQNHANTKNINQITWSQAALIGVIQSLAIIPGVSRAGAVILGMLGLGYSRVEAAKYSFILAIPTILAAGLLDIIQARDIIFSGPDFLWLTLVGGLTSFVTALFVSKVLIKYLQKRGLAIFGYYRLLIACLWFVSFVI